MLNSENYIKLHCNFLTINEKSENKIIEKS